MMANMMRGVAVLALFTAVGPAGFTRTVHADNESEPHIKKDGDRITIRSTSTANIRGTSVDFPVELDLPFESLATLGARIEQARHNADPVGLAVCARELAAAEAASGQHTTLTSEMLDAEVDEMVRQRFRSQELLAVSRLVSNTELSQDLAQLAKQAAEAEQKQREAAEAGEMSRGIRTLIVRNHSKQFARVYVNGSFAFSVQPYGRAYGTVGTYGDETCLKARGASGGYWHQDVAGQWREWTWNLYP